MGAPSKNAQNGDLRRLILDTARHLLVQDGYSNLSMRRIASEIDYSATSIYLYFDNKDMLLHALIDEGMNQLFDALSTIAKQHQSAPIDRLEALCDGFISFGLDNPEYYEIMFQLRPERMERYPPEKYREARRNLDFFRMTLAEGASAGVFDVVDPRVCASSVWASLHGTVSLLLAERVDVRIDRADFIQAAIRQTLRSYTTSKTAYHP
ncbi:TetR family transcriptional regulator [Longibacter salinarum]|uniref:TetR family transcriptional regulator n=1 Tax=Longibacter salinarum TaxID=1850348 RepID=A0A2A8CZF9_9BACT|nr:TetR/AcrR family transcriptional regulator [Longibacter salinarum]PEN14026.1 TetR family transcriptional regulator [Longibacter salinarum]